MVSQTIMIGGRVWLLRQVRGAFGALQAIHFLATQEKDNLLLWTWALQVVLIENRRKGARAGKQGGHRPWI